MAAVQANPHDIADLVSRLTLEQKIAQLGGVGVPQLFGPPPPGGTGPVVDTGRLREERPYGVGHFSLAWALGEDTDSLRAALADLQAVAREVSPFGIGALVHFEGISGLVHPSGPQFPTAWAQAATWDSELVRRASSVTSAHMRDTGVQLLFSPVMDICRDPRWGRVHETYGEDPELAAQMSVAFVRGIQGDLDDTGVLATGKHFLGYGVSEGALNQAQTQLGKRTLVDEYAEPFRRAIREAGLSVVMNSYNEIDGIPAAADHWLLTEFLRGALGFDGVVVSDYDAVNMLRTAHRTAGTHGQAAVQALSAGLDVELPGDDNYSHLADEVAAGRLDEQVIDAAVARALAIKARVGLIPSLGRATRVAAAVRADRAEAAEVRRAMAERAIVLLDNDGTLPLTPGGPRIVVVGPAADELRIHFGAYTSAAHNEMWEGIRAVRTGQVPGIDPASFAFTDIFQTRLPGIDPAFEAVTRRLHPDAPSVLDALRAVDPKVDFASLGSFEADSAQPLDPAAVAGAVAAADVVVAVVGERTGWVGNNTAGEGQSTASPTLPGDQEDLVELLAATGKPLVTVVVSGRPLLLEKVARASRAVVLAPLLGEAAGQAIADVLFGRVNPSGRIPSTFPRHLGQLPLYHGHHHGSGYSHPTGTRHGYGDLTAQGPLYPFGHGLSYTTFAVEPDETHESVLDVADGVIRARLTVANSGDVDGETVVQLYARDELSAVVRPVRQLIAFARVALAAGERRQVVLEAPVERLFHTMADGRRGVAPGDITVMAGFSSTDIVWSGTTVIDGAYEDTPGHH
ncbi:glycoside hydrolase family 3 N-terminal domain-containing protein [Yinghuangia aomiensis]|uniref:Glycoside hydrolase family 3 N-terminal domain-containing protein n=1 Tax=Yinghuangia aomiensis TaxID=676205 RepID=A0ABP9IC48_9ACTN